MSLLSKLLQYSLPFHIRNYRQQIGRKLKGSREASSVTKETGQENAQQSRDSEKIRQQQSLLNKRKSWLPTVHKTALERLKASRNSNSLETSASICTDPHTYWSNLRFRRRKTFADPELLLNLPEENLISSTSFIKPSAFSTSGMDGPASTSLTSFMSTLAPTVVMEDQKVDSVQHIIGTYYYSLLAYSSLLKYHNYSDSHSGDCRAVEKTTESQERKKSGAKGLPFSVEAILNM